MHITFCGFRRKPYVSVDGKRVRLGADWETEGVRLQVSKRAHRVTVCERAILYQWYWWVLFFHLLYPLLCFRGFSGKHMGYDGECASATVTVACADGGPTCLKITKREIPWERTQTDASYHTLALAANVPMRMETADLDAKRRFRLKCSMIMPFVLFSLAFTVAFVALLLRPDLPSSEIIGLTAAEIAVLIYGAYKIRKIAMQKSFSELSDVARIEFSKMEV